MNTELPNQQETNQENKEEFYTQITIDHDSGTIIENKTDKRQLKEDEYLYVKESSDNTKNYPKSPKEQVLINCGFKSESKIKVIDSKTGKEIKTLIPVGDINILDDIVITVRKNELNDWQSEIKEAEKLTSEQKTVLKTFVSEYGKDRPLTRREIATFIEEVRKPKKPERYRQSGHLVDQKLKYKPKSESQLTIFDYLSPKAQEEIQKYELKVEGIHLTPPQDKLINTLNKLLHSKSEHIDSKSPLFYLGNDAPALTPYGKKDTPSAVIRFTPHELYSEYIGSKDYSGADIAFIKEVLGQISDKKFLITYDRHRKVKSGKKTEKLIDKIVEFQPLIKVIRFYEGLSEHESRQINSGEGDSDKGEIVLALNPIFTDQIDTKYIEYPVDINRRMVIAAGGANRVTQSMSLLRDWLFRALSNKQRTWEIDEKNLPSALKLDKYVKQGRKKLLRERIEKDIQAMVNLGLVLKAEKTTGAKGQLKYIFHLNKDYDKGK